jgi:hypothetical protein
MAAFTRVNGAGAAIVGTLTTTAQLKAYLITVKDDSNTAIDLRSDDGVVEGKLEQLLREISPLMYFATDSSAGTVTVVVDGHANDATSIRNRVRQIFGATSDPITDNDSTVTLATSLVAS